jgi:hypothetical protein
MKAPAPIRSLNNVLLGAALAAALVWLPACKPAAPPALPAPKPKPAVTALETNAPMAQTNNSEQFVSVFNDVLPPDKGKDPFYPSSTRRLKVITPPTQPNVVVHTEPLLVLKGTIKGRSAIINSAELELGEERGVRVLNGRVAVKVLEIGDDYAIVAVAGEPAPKKLMLEHKKSSHENH